jgi:hypothetical protein
LNIASARCNTIGPHTTVHARAKDVNDLDSANLPLIGDTLTQRDPVDIPSTSHWTGAAIIGK